MNRYKKYIRSKGVKLECDYNILPLDCGTTRLENVRCICIAGYPIVIREYDSTDVYMILRKSGNIEPINQKEYGKLIDIDLSYNYRYYKRYLCDMNHYIAIQALEQQRWIPVSKRLPEKTGYYLVSTIGFEVWISFYDHNSKFWFYERDVFPFSKIYAWQGLPASYKGEVR